MTNEELEAKLAVIRKEITELNDEADRLIQAELRERKMCSCIQGGTAYDRDKPDPLCVQHGQSK